MKYDGSLPSSDDRDHVWTGVIRGDDVYLTDEPDCADECLGIHNSPEGPVDCDGRPI